MTSPEVLVFGVYLFFDISTNELSENVGSNFPLVFERPPVAVVIDPTHHMRDYARDFAIAVRIIVKN